MNVFFVIIFTFFSMFIFGQSSDTVFFDSNWGRMSSYDSLGFYGFKNYDSTGKGMAIYYFGSGELHSHQSEINNIKHGYCTWFYKNGQKMAEGNYNNDLPSGDLIWYTEKGKIDRIGKYEVLDEPFRRVDDTIDIPIVGDVTISQPEYKELYRGYKNKLEIGFLSNNTFEFGLFCRGCDTIYHVENNRFVVVPGYFRVAYIEVYNIGDTSNYELVHRMPYKVKNIPAPTIYIGHQEEMKEIDGSSERIVVKYPPEIWLDYSYRLKKWNIEIGNKRFVGNGDKITKEVQSQIKKMRVGQKINLTVTIIGENNEELIIETFFLKASQRK